MDALAHSMPGGKSKRAIFKVPEKILSWFTRDPKKESKYPAKRKPKLRPTLCNVCHRGGGTFLCISDKRVPVQRRLYIHDYCQRKAAGMPDQRVAAARKALG